MGKIGSFFGGVKKEVKRTRWPKKKELLKYSIVTIVMIVFFALFFWGLDALFAFLRGLM